MDDPAVGPEPADETSDKSPATDEPNTNGVAAQQEPPQEPLPQDAAQETAELNATKEVPGELHDEVPEGAVSQPPPAAVEASGDASPPEVPPEPLSEEGGEASPSDETERKIQTQQPGDAAARMGRILDLELPVSVSFGSVLRPLSDVLELKTGVILELDTDAEDGAILKVNQRPFARGEIVEVEGHYGLRITTIESKSQRISALEGKS